MTPLRHRPAYRVLRVARAVALTVPSYTVLLWRERFPRLAPAPEAWTRAHERAAARVERLALELAGLFVKVAQIMGARADVFPEPFLRRLGRFHDAVPPRPFADLRAAVERDLGAACDAVFADVDERPLAAASLAQVHRATLRATGQEVVLKIRYPEIGRLTRVDLASVRRVAALVARIQKRVDFRSLVDEVARFIALELDFEREARSTERVARAFAGDAGVRIPAIHAEHSRGGLLVLEYLDGIRITDVDALRRAGHDLPELARRVARVYCAMIFDQGFFQGDPHPGNLLVLADGALGLLDFGLCKELPPRFGERVAALFVSALAGDAAAALRAAGELGFDARGVDPASVRPLIAALFGEPGAGGDLLAVLDGSPLRAIPSDFPLIARTLILLNGLSHVLAPGERLIPQEILRALAPRVAALRAAS